MNVILLTFSFFFVGLVFFWCTSPLVTKVILPSPGPAHLLVDEKHRYHPIVNIIHHYHNHDYRLLVF